MINTTDDNLNDILQFLYDSKDCYQNNIENVSDNNLKQLFGYLSQQRSQMIDEIKDEIIKLGGNPKTSGTLIGKVHELYENIKNMIKSADSLAITKEIKRGESMLVECYKEALKTDIPETSKKILMAHLEQIDEELKRIDLTSVNQDPGSQITSRNH